MRVLNLESFGFKLPYTKLYYEGTLPNKRFVGIVGTRQAGKQWCNFAASLGKAFAENGFCVVSGFASGIDISAHLGCLESGVPGSVLAILATPIDKVYPAEHQGIVNKVLNNGGVVATINPGNLTVHKSDFVLRNSVISAFSEVLFFIQGSTKSGAMHTVKYALDFGKEVYVCPGPPWDSNCTGTNQLIKEGCPIITSVDDALEIFGIRKKEKQVELTDDERLVLSVIKSVKPCFIESLFERTGLSIVKLDSALQGLESKGLIEQIFTGEILTKLSY